MPGIFLPSYKLELMRGPLVLAIGNEKENSMNQIIWIVGAVVIVLAILSFFGLR